MSTKLPLLALLIASVFWGTAISATKYALDGFGPVTLLAVSLVSGTVVLWLAILVRGHGRAPGWRRLALLALFEPALAYGGEMLGLNRTTAANGALLTGLESVFVVLLAAVFLREGITRRIGFAVAVAVAGLAILEGTSFAGPGVGDLLVLGGVLSAAAYTIVARGLDGGCDSLTLTAYQFSIASLLVLPVATGAWATHTEAMPTQVSARYWLAALVVGILGYAGSFVLYNFAIVRVAAGPASIIINLIPVFGLISAVLWLGDAMTPPRVIGASLIGISVLIFAAIELRDARERPPLAAVPA